MSSTSYPQKVQIETFHGCNARCPMCTSDKWERKSGMMSDAVFSRIIEEVIPIKKHLRVVSLFGDGEPLLDKRFAQRVELCKQNDLPNVGATSNASLLSEVKSRDILNAGMDWITFSIDSVDKGSYEKIRVQLDFETVMANISRHIGLRNQLHPSSKIILRFSEQPENYGQFQTFFDYWSSQLNPDLDEIQRIPLHNWGRGAQESLEFSRAACYYVLHYCVIKSDGIIPMCCVDYNAEMVFGNIMETTLLDIWNGPIWQRARRLHREGRRTELPICATCDIPRLADEGLFQNLKLA